MIRVPGTGAPGWRLIKVNSGNTPPFTTPATFNSVVGFQHDLDVPLPDGFKTTLRTTIDALDSGN